MENLKGREIKKEKKKKKKKRKTYNDNPGQKILPKEKKEKKQHLKIRASLNIKRQLL